MKQNKGQGQRLNEAHMAPEPPGETQFGVYGLGFYRGIFGLHRENGKENGSYCLGFREPSEELEPLADSHDGLPMP